MKNNIQHLNSGKIVLCLRDPQDRLFVRTISLIGTLINAMKKIRLTGVNISKWYPQEFRLVEAMIEVNGNRLGKSFVCSDLYNKFDKRQDDEMKKGNAIRLIYGNPEPQKNSIIFAVLQLSRPGEEKELSVYYRDGVLTVNGAKIRLLDNGISVIANGLTEDFTYTKQDDLQSSIIK